MRGDAADAHHAESRAYLLLAAGTFLVYVLAGLVLPDLYGPFKFFFGINQYKRLGAPGTAVLCVAGLAALLLLRRFRGRVESCVARLRPLIGGRSGTVAVAVACAGVFFALRNNFLNADARDLIWKFARDVPLVGSHVTHDEMWELYLHSRFWYYAHRYLGWNVVLSYQVLSSLAGGLFVALLLRYARLVSPAKPAALTLLVASGGFMQLFFGDVENYTLTGVLVLGYLYASAAFLAGRCSIALPSALLALAMTAHLLAGWLIPSLAYLYVLELRRRRFHAVLPGAVLFATILGATLIFFHFNGLPIGDLFDKSHAFGEGGDILSKLAAPSPRYYLGLVNLLLLLVPAAPLGILLLALRRIEASPLNLHLLLASTFMLLYMFTWKATLGVYSDWNLFANAAIPLSILVWSNALRARDGPRLDLSLLALFWVYAMHSYAWIVGNHLRG